MRVRQFRLARRALRRFTFLATVAQVGLASLMICASATEVRGQRSRTPEPTKQFTVSGQVSLPDERPAVRVRVRLTGRGGINLETVANEDGRYEFTELPPGSYSLSAFSLIDPSLSSSPVETDTRLAAVGSLTVNLTLRPADSKASHRPGRISVAEVEQKIPKAARQAFKQGLKLRDNNRPDEALASFSRAVELHPDYFQALAERGDLRVSRRELAEAAQDFERALKVNAQYEPALRGAGYCKLEGREFAQAIEFFERAAAVEPGNASTRLLLGIAKLELGRRDEARQSLQQALKIDAVRAVRAHIYLANIFAHEHQYQQAADQLRLYLDVAVTDPNLSEMRKVEARWRALAKAK